MMAVHSESFFEAPAADGTSRYSSPEAAHLFGSAEMASEFEEEAQPYSNPEAGAFELNEMQGEGEYEWGESEISPETNFEFEEEASLFGTPEVGQEAGIFENPEATSFEGEVNELSGFTGESEFEWEGEFEGEADAFFGRIARLAKRVAKVAAPLAKRFAPVVARSLVGMIPGVGALAAPLAGKLVGSLVQEAEMEVAELENQLTQLFAQPEISSESVHPELQDAALTELYAADAATQSEAEAEVSMSAALPITITIMGARRPLRRVMPVLTQANARMVQTLSRQGPVGRQLIRTVPTIQRRTIALLKGMARRGQPISAPLAVKTMAAAANRVLSDPRLVSRSIQRNVGLRVRTAPLRPRRAVVYAPRQAMRRAAVPRSTYHAPMRTAYRVR